MHIVTIEVLRLAIPYKDGSAMNEEKIFLHSEGEALTGFSSTKTMEALLIKVTTDTGLIGWGEAFGHMINSSTMAALVDCIGPFFLGAPIELEDPMTASPRILEAHKAFHLFGRTGPALYAISGIDIALWDLKAQTQGKPLYQLLGGVRNTIPCYASLVPYNENIEAAVRNSLQAYQVGFKHIKLHEKEFATIHAVREALPADAALMVDVNCAWLPAEANRRTEKLKSLDLDWLEEPVWPPDDFESLAKLRKIGLPLAAGENSSGIDGYTRAMKAGALDIIQPSATKIGGITGMLEAYQLGLQYGVRVQPHCFYYGAGLHATAHVASSMCDSTMLEVPWIHLSDSLTPETAFKPRWQFNDTPGLGFSPDPAIIEKYLKASALMHQGEANMLR